MSFNKCGNLDHIISGWPGVSRRQTQSQIVFSRLDTNFCWLSPRAGMIQLRPPLGRNCDTRRLQRQGNEVGVIRQKTEQVDAAYQDPGGRLIALWGYPGFMCRSTPVTDAQDLIRQAYDNLKANNTMPNQQESVFGYSSSRTDQAHNTHGTKITVTQIASLYRFSTTRIGFSKQPAWLDILAHAVAELPRGCQDRTANELLATILRKAGVRMITQVKVSPRSSHSVDFVIESDGDKVGVELGTGQAERVELDLLKLINLALRQEINCACLVLPRDVARHSVMGKQCMSTAVKGLAYMCSPLFDLIKPQLQDIFVVLYI